MFNYSKSFSAFIDPPICGLFLCVFMMGNVDGGGGDGEVEGEGKEEHAVGRHIIKSGRL